MSQEGVIPEIDVVIATARWLWMKKPKIYPYRISIARGQQIHPDRDRKRLLDELKEEMPFVKYSAFAPIGPDIVGLGQEYWQIECKGYGLGKTQTHRNNFDRALASVVSYFVDKLPTLDDEFQQLIQQDAKPFLGLALPMKPEFRSQLGKRVRQPLRRVLNLWILLYDPATHKISSIAPNQDY